MQTPRPVNLRTLLMAVDAVIISATWLGLTWFRSRLLEFVPSAQLPGGFTLQEVGLSEHLPLIGLILPIWLFTLSRTRSYDTQRRIRRDLLLLRISKAVVLGMLVALGILFVTHVTDYLSRSLMLSFGVINIFALFLGRLASRRLIERWGQGMDRWGLLVVGEAGDVDGLLDILARRGDWGIQMLGALTPINSSEPENPVLPHLGTVADLDSVLSNQPVDQVLMTGRAWPVDTVRTVADTCAELGVRFSMEANFLDLSQSRPELSDLEGWSILHFCTGPTDVGALVAKRTMDLTIAAAALTLLTPVFLFTALSIRIQDGGPALFKQQRAGLYGRPFTMLKFRSMVMGAEQLRPGLDHLNEVVGPAFKVHNDPRITPFGRMIRRLSIDELPQLWNVLRGEMSLVGPRPPLLPEVVAYERWQLRRLSMKPGLTCTWQVAGRSNVDFDTWMALDLEYIDNWSLFLDLKLLVRTVPVVLLGTGAR